MYDCTSHGAKLVSNSGCVRQLHLLQMNVLPKQHQDILQLAGQWFIKIACE
jgi:hypothetical protein